MRGLAAVGSTVLLLGAIIGPSPVAAASETWLYNPATNHYYAQVVGLNWADSEAFAVSRGGHLVTINNQAEQDWLASTFPQPNLWIGFNDRAKEGTWVWSSGQTPGYTNWSPSEPNNHPRDGGGDEDAAVMNWQRYQPGNSGWNDLPENEGCTLDDPGYYCVLAGIIEAKTPSSGKPIVFNVRKDFQLSPSQANPNGVWSYRETYRNGTRRLLTHFSTHHAGINGMEAWTDNKAYLSWPWVPVVEYNNTGHDVYYMPADRLFVHPSVDHAIVIRWKAPVTGRISISLSLIDSDAGGGNGVGWSIAKLHRRPVASGTIANGGTAQAYVARVNVKAGDRIDLKVNAQQEEGWDTTQVELKITFWPD